MPPSESIFARGLWQHALWVGLLMGGVTLAIQAFSIDLGWHWQTMVFTTLAFLQLGHALAVRSERESFFRLGWRTNKPLIVAVAAIVAVQLAIIYLPALQAIFETEALSPIELGVMLALGLRPISIFRVVFIESMMLAVLGLAIGLALAVPVALWMQANPIAMGGDLAGMSEFVGIEPVISSHLAVSTVWKSGLMILVVALLAALYPALKASRANPIDALRSL